MMLSIRKIKGDITNLLRNLELGIELQNNLWLSILNIGLSTLATDSSGKLDVLRHDCHPFGMDSTQVGVFKQTNQVRLTGFLKI